MLKKINYVDKFSNIISYPHFVKVCDVNVYENVENYLSLIFLIMSSTVSFISLFSCIC